eukprot:2094387-Pleurochrysis_carterae.AAC.1
MATVQVSNRTKGAKRSALITPKVGHRQFCTAIYADGGIFGMSLTTRSDASDRQLCFKWYRLPRDHDVYGASRIPNIQTINIVASLHYPSVRIVIFGWTMMYKRGRPVRILPSEERSNTSFLQNNVNSANHNTSLAALRLKHDDLRSHCHFFVRKRGGGSDFLRNKAGSDMNFSRAIKRACRTLGFLTVPITNMSDCSNFAFVFGCKLRCMKVISIFISARRRARSMANSAVFLTNSDRAMPRTCGSRNIYNSVHLPDAGTGK